MFKRHTVASLSFAFTLIGVLSLHVAAQSHCEETLFPVQASTNNYNLSGLDATPPTTPTRDVAIAGTFVLRFRFCERTERNSSRDDTLLVLSPGATYSSLYWHWPLQPETYNFARFAATNGFHTLSVDRLGNEHTQHPDPERIVQVPLQSALLAQIIQAARGGEIPGSRGRQFKKVVGIGHSLSSAIFNDLISSFPQVLDAVVLSGYAHVSGGAPQSPSTLPGFLPARDVVPERFGHLPAGYLTSENITTRAGLYGPAGTYDPSVLAFDEAHKDTVSIGEFVTHGLAQQPAPEFRGDVLAIVGSFDWVFCPVPGCENLQAEETFYPNANSVDVAIIENSGHDLNLHLTAPMFFRAVVAWLGSKGF